jgi:hypothetical protein
MTLFFLVLTGATIYAVRTVVGQDGAWVSTVVAEAMAKRATKATKGKNLGEKIADKLLENDGELAIKIIKKALQRPPSKGNEKPKGAGLLLSKAIDRLLANDGQLLGAVLARMNKKKKPPLMRAFDKLLANDGRMLAKVIIKINQANRRSGRSTPLPKLLLKHPKVISAILGDVLERVGVKSVVRTAQSKVRSINTRVNLQREIRYALGQLPKMLVGVMSLQQKKKMLDRKAWRNIKAQFPRIKRSFQSSRSSKCLHLVRLRRIKDNIIRARVRVKMLTPGCARIACNQHVQHVDKAILRWTQKYGVHEGQIQVRFNLLKNKCNTNR